ncbi:MAG: phosphoribosylglycinamide formyltransferase [Desulfobulbaceae bacterium]|jgi:phosphoribosylglycinamide formyltransferase-1|nr:phosphoribosylglycinamide formyltransferase [Desulfobulbaceae bacterium]HKJ13403.1 phosphoribosylglycinamide formyltransferase [Desulfobulbales bacterium]MDH3776472.1 phosphoribosylglycinamide formyltransferase [Desulfobulbaceae bacterium]MDH3781359.1 phosphoribosylglycinamide formyltransferase [Desulfobulbaceae bacterium]MDH3866478.1 phosphoribosylglycinamide formyltransferase [Desulfobulbaceae bacterium]
MQKMAVLLSGSGRTLDNFHERIQDGSLNAEIKVVISNVKDVLGLQKAEKYGYPNYHAVGNGAINEILKDYDVNLICLAGYLKLYEPPPELQRNVLNIHPALIPSFCGDGFYGMRVHRAAKAKGVTVSGCTVHFADNRYDEGPIVVQKCVPLAYDDTPEEIAAKVFAVECIAFPEAINLVDEKGIDFFWRRVENGA